MRWLGRFAGNLALTLLARGGVYIAGGIVPGWGAVFDGALFRQGFEEKAPFAPMLTQIPTFVNRHPQPGLLGLARLGSVIRPHLLLEARFPASGVGRPVPPHSMM